MLINDLGKTFGKANVFNRDGAGSVNLEEWRETPVWQKSGRGSLRPGRPVWVRVGEPIDLSGRAVSVEDRDGVTALTAELMEALTREVVRLRASYPARWTAR